MTVANVAPMRGIRRLALLLVLSAVAIVAIRRRRPTLTGQPPQWPPLDVGRSAPGPAESESAALIELITVEAIDAGVVDVVELVEVDGAPVALIEVVEPVEMMEGLDDAARLWASPVDGACPVEFPVKANASSGIFHVPGGRSYARTKPERCYATPEDAEADGFRRAKL